MDVLAQFQTMLGDQMMVVMLGLLAAVIVVGLVWYWMSRKTQSDVLVNKARVNEATTVNSEPPQEQQEQQVAPSPAPEQPSE
jgi:flagellar biosynthesis/type III secretory pathway M-ring protein FliF/YscJ